MVPIRIRNYFWGHTCGRLHVRSDGSPTQDSSTIPIIPKMDSTSLSAFIAIQPFRPRFLCVHELDSGIDNYDYVPVRSTSHRYCCQRLTSFPKDVLGASLGAATDLCYYICIAAGCHSCCSSVPDRLGSKVFSIVPNRYVSLDLHF